MDALETRHRLLSTKWGEIRVRLGDILRSKAKVESPEPLVAAEASTWREEVVSLPLEEIAPNPFQPRREFAEEQLEELAASIQEHGVLHPVVVRPKGDKFELVVGERRFRACRMLGWEKIPAIIRELSDGEMAEIALIENLQREGLNFFEEAEGYRRLLDEFGLTQEELAKRLGKSQSAVANKLRLLRFEAPVREVISREMLSERHARALLKIEGTEKQLEVLQEVIEKGLNVRETEHLIEKRLGPDPAPQVTAKDKRRTQLIRGVYKDYRLLRNSIKKLVDQMTADGAKVEFDEVEEGTFVEMRIRIHHQDKGGR